MGSETTSAEWVGIIEGMQNSGEAGSSVIAVFPISALEISGKMSPKGNGEYKVMNFGQLPVTVVDTMQIKQKFLPHENGGSGPEGFSTVMSTNLTGEHRDRVGILYVKKDIYDIRGGYVQMTTVLPKDTAVNLLRDCEADPSLVEDVFGKLFDGLDKVVPTNNPSKLRFLVDVRKSAISRYKVNRTLELK